MKVENKWCATHQRNSKSRKKNCAQNTNEIVKVENKYCAKHQRNGESRKQIAQNTYVIVKVEKQ